MTRKTRFILFSFLTILFFLLAPSTVFYSQGYRFDFEKKKIVQTGAFYFKIMPKGAEIYLNDKLKKKTDFFFGQAFIDDLLPKIYKVEIKKDGYYPWQKNLKIEEKLTTELKNVFLVPKDIKFQILGKEIEDFYFSPNNKMVILKRIEKGNLILELLEIEKNTPSLLFKTEDFLEKGEKIEDLDLIWSGDSKKILIKLIGKKEKYFILELDRGKNLISLDFLGENLSEFSFEPGDSEKIWFIKKSPEKNSLLFSNYLKKEVSKPILENILSYQIANGNLFWLNKDGFLIQSDLLGREITTLNFEPFSLKEKVKYQIMVFERKIFLREGNILYFFDEKEKTFEKILEKVREVKISPDLKKIAYFTDYEIWIFFLKDILNEQPQRKEEEKLFLTRFSEKIGNIFWWTNHYLIFNTGNQIKITEIDDRDKINIYDLVEFKDPKIFWSKFDKKLYILSQGNFYSSEKLIP